MYLEDEQEPRAAVSRRSGRKKKSARQTTDFIHEHATRAEKEGMSAPAVDSESDSDDFF